MNLSVSEIADVVAAGAVVASLLFVAYQIRQNTRSVRAHTFQSIIDRVATINSRTPDIYVATTIAKGRKNYLAFADEEKITFG